MSVDCGLGTLSLEHGRKGHWSIHDYKRHSVKEIRKFVGWPKLTELCETFKDKKSKSLPAVLFLTGGRISEIVGDIDKPELGLKPSNFDLSDQDFVFIHDMHIVKQKKVNPLRFFYFRKDEPLWSYANDWLEHCLKYKIDRFLKMDRTWAWRLVKGHGKKVDLDIWNHWFRSQRASQLVLEYGFSTTQLQEWFNVIDPTWNRIYGKMGEEGLRNLMMPRKA